jgi:hypothetical protein
MADASIPSYKDYREGEPIPPVDPEDLKRMWRLRPPSSWEDQRAACGPGADIAAIWRRRSMIWMLADFDSGQLLAPWQHGEKLDDAVFRIAATFPLREHKHRGYKIAGDEHFGFDPNAFVQRLIEETGIAHVWTPVVTKVPEGGRGIVTTSVNFTGQTPNPERNAKQQARQLLWDIWSRLANLDRLLSHSDEQAFSDKESFRLATELFDDFVADSVDLLREVEAKFRADGFPPMETLAELERRAQRRV